MNIDKKLNILQHYYDLYETFLQSYTFACKRYCDDCCTCNVTMTTLEAYYLIDNLISENKTEVLTKLNVSQKRFQPKHTFNMVADLWAKGKDIFEEQSDPSWGRCPFLKNKQCRFYDYRPFGCRCMVSVKCCSENGFAEMAPMIITANQVFMQFIEHVDSHGYSGNFTDVLKWMENETNKNSYVQHRIKKTPPNLLSNIPIPVLMVPPEHRKEMVSLVFALNKLLI